MEEKELTLEKEYLAKVNLLIRDKLSEMGSKMFANQEKIKEFQEYMWNSKADLDPQEMASVMVATDLEWFFLDQKRKYFNKLYRTQDKPYFGRIDFFEELDNTLHEIYIGITHLQDDDDRHYIHDWRSPICSLFYDYELGLCEYIAPEGYIKGELRKKRQYQIKNTELIHVFDNDMNINDELLQQVLATDSNDKMKNIVNTIQKEQNSIIRDVTKKVLIVQGIAGSGKTSVALHRIAFLLYKLEKLSSKHVLVFSPNQIFTEYISNVLPELGEENTMQTTFRSFLKSHINEYKEIESFTGFISRYYRYTENNPELVKYKQSDIIVHELNNYLEAFVKNLKFIHDFKEGHFYYSADELNHLFHGRYNKFTAKERLDAMATKFSENNYGGRVFKTKTYLKLLKASLNNPLDYKKIYQEFYNSEFCSFNIKTSDLEKLNGKMISYEDASLFVYLKGMLEGFEVNTSLREIVIDEAQDYTLLQYLIINKIFKKAHFTILGDINQTINPYYKYNSLQDLNNIFKDSRYLELTKTYRSSPEIINYSNQILNLNLVSAIRQDNDTPIIYRKEDLNLKYLLQEDIKYLKSKYQSLAIITKDDLEADRLFEMLKDTSEINLVNELTEGFNKDLIIIPAYMAKGLEFDSVIIYNRPGTKYQDNEKYLLYVAITRAQHELIVYN